MDGFQEVQTERKEEVTLSLWTEIVGRYNGLTTDEDFVYVQIGDKSLRFPIKSSEATIARRELADKMNGQRIAILRSDEPTRPLLFRIINRTRMKEDDHREI